MTSIHVNHGAMLALSTLSNINQNLLQTQNAISTGKDVANSADDAAIWAVTTVMEADVDGFNAISESLSLGKATVTVARNASERITDLLREVKGKVVTAQGENVDREKIQVDIDELRLQIQSVIGAAQFNGLNLIDGSSDGNFSILASLDRSATSVDTSDINVARQDLSIDSGVFGTTAATLAAVSGAALDSTADGTVSFDITANTGGSGTFEFDFGGGNVVTSTIASTLGGDDAFALKLADDINDAAIDGITADVNDNTLIITNANSFATFTVDAEVTGVASAQIDGTNAATVSKDLVASGEALTLNGRSVSEGDSYRVTLSRDTNDDGTVEDINFDYVAQDGDDVNDVGEALRALIEADNNFSDVTMMLDRSEQPTLQAAHLRIDTSSDTTIGFAQTTMTGGESGSGGLGDLATLSVTTGAAASDALDTIEELIQTAVDAASSFGSSEKRVGIQEKFVTSLVNSLTSGVSALADTNMEKASASLQSLQVQQQLATQALSIANTAPQNLLSLFR